MNLLIIIWSMFAAACGLLGLIQLFLLANSQREPVYLLSALMALSAAAAAVLEMTLFSTADPERYQQLLVWQNLVVAMVIVPMVWSVRVYLPTARTWVALLITSFWVTGLLVNFFMPGNLTFVEIQSIDQKVTPWGDVFYVPNGTANDWKWLADITVILIPLYIIDAAWRARKLKLGKRGLVITLGIVVFMLFGGGEAILVDAGIFEAPYMISVAFFSMVLALTWVLAHDAVQARSLALEVARAHSETERIMRANLLGEVAAALAHEINQPLAAILGNAQAAQKFLARPEPDLDEIREIQTDIVRDDKRARDIILNMRQMLKGDESLYTNIDLESLILETLEFLKSELQKQKISASLYKIGQAPVVTSSRVALQQVIMNLLVNAIQALQEVRPSRREISIFLREKQKGAEIEVRDFGPGIAKELQSRLFEPFVTTKSGNLGMGMTICQRIVEAQGGQLTAENAEGGGARFRVWLPAGVH
jgi:signal transduction histidine kinase